MKRKWISILLMVLILSLTSGCQEAGKDSAEGTTGKITLYYLNPEQDGLVSKEKDILLSDDPETNALQVLDELSQVDGNANFKYSSVFNKQVQHQKVSIDEEEVASISFGSGYKLMEPNREILMRAAIVKSIVQLDGISSVTFFVNDDPLANEDGTLVGRMDEETFVLDDDKNHVYDYTETVSLFCSNLKGDGLVEVTVDLEARGNQSMEEAALEALKENWGDNVKSPIPKELTFNRIHVIQNICYVDLNDEIRQHINGVDEEIKVYSMVNTLTSLTRITRVQFTVNGETVSNMNDVAGFDTPMSHDYSFVEESGE